MTRADRCDGYPPISNYALIGNCHTAALVSREGSIDWYCPRRFDDPAVFCRLLDKDRGGYLSVSPEEECGIGRHYLGDSNILQTEYSLAGATLTVTDFMPVDEGLRRGAPQPTVDVEAESRIVRILEAGGDDVRVRIQFSPTFDYARRVPEEVNTSEAGVIAGCGSSWLSLSCPQAEWKQTREHCWEGSLTIPSGKKVFLYLTFDDCRPAAERALRYQGGEKLLAQTKDFWEEWAARCTYRGPYRAAVMRSALTLKLLIYEPTGAIIAAPTTSLPESIGGVRNWDYRYTWLRDSSLTLYSLVTLGYHGEAAQFTGWLRRTVGRHLDRAPQILYTIDGQANIPERSLEYLDGYRSSKPVRVGNAAAQQCQLDIYGELLVAAYIHFHRPKGEETPVTGGLPELDADTWTILRGLVDDAVRFWKQPDEGIWEVRGGPRQFLYSKLMCWTALDRGIRLAEEYSLQADLPKWKRTRREIREAIEHEGYNQKVGAFVQSFGSDVLDAATLAIPRVGFLPANDPRVKATIDAIKHRLVHSGLVFRYLGSDGLPGHEGAFLLCTFWLVDALSLSGRIDEAREHYEAMLGRANDVCLFSEEIDPDTGEFLGNFPQGFTHLSIIRSAVDLAKTHQHGAEEEPETEAERAHKAHHASKHGHG